MRADSKENVDKRDLTIVIGAVLYDYASVGILITQKIEDVKDSLSSASRSHNCCRMQRINVAATSC